MTYAAGNGKSYATRDVEDAKARRLNHPSVLNVGVGPITCSESIFG